MPRELEAFDYNIVRQHIKVSLVLDLSSGKHLLTLMKDQYQVDPSELTLRQMEMKSNKVCLHCLSVQLFFIYQTVGGRCVKQTTAAAKISAELICKFDL